MSKRVDLALRTTRFGSMVYLPNDMYVGRSLDAYGEFSKDEGDLFQLICPGRNVVEVGANIGAHTIGIAKVARQVWAYEAQPFIAKLLAMNKALNNLANLEVLVGALGAEQGVVNMPLMDYSLADNWGAIGREVWSAGKAEWVTTPVKMTTLDEEFPASREVKIDLLKVDVEGMEREVLAGGKELIARDKPVMFVENDRPEKAKELIELIEALGYRATWHFAPLFAPGNFDKNEENIFDKEYFSFNLVCTPLEGSWLNYEGGQACTSERPFLEMIEHAS